MGLIEEVEKRNQPPKPAILVMCEEAKEAGADIIELLKWLWAHELRHHEIAVVPKLVAYGVRTVKELEGLDVTDVFELALSPVEERILASAILGLPAERAAKAEAERAERAAKAEAERAKRAAKAEAERAERAEQAERAARRRERETEEEMRRSAKRSRSVWAKVANFCRGR